MISDLWRMKLKGSSKGYSPPGSRPDTYVQKAATAITVGLAASAKGLEVPKVLLRGVQGVPRTSNIGPQNSCRYRWLCG